MDVLKKEYDEFGPWILEIRNEEEIPPLFKEYVCFDEHLELAFKVPRNVERRHVKMGMNLYDYVIAIYGDRLSVVSRDNGNIGCKNILYKEILVIQNLRELLKGGLKIYTAEEVFEIEYNTVSYRIIESITALLRKRYLTENERVKDESELGEISEPVLSPLFLNLLKDVKEEEEAWLLGYQPTVKIDKYKKSWLEKFWNSNALQDSMYLTNKKELIIINRKRLVKRRMEPDYSYMHTYIPLNDISFIRAEDNKEFLNVKNILISVGSREFTFMTQDKRDLNKWLTQFCYQ